MFSLCHRQLKPGHRLMESLKTLLAIRYGGKMLGLAVIQKAHSLSPLYNKCKKHIVFNFDSGLVINLF
jgi:hypothetical protein